MKKGPFKMKMKQYGQGKNPITRKDVTGDGVYTKKDLLVERGVPGFEKGMDNNKKSPAELGRLKNAFGGALSKLGLGRKKGKSSGSGGRRGFGGGVINAFGNLGGAKRLVSGAGGKIIGGALGMGSGVMTSGNRPKNTVGRVAKGAINLFNRRR
tara:strand:- start:760 stop:1221 length:462 start_codon:yes stop_codon:yes gene_type:complete